MTTSITATLVVVVPSPFAKEEEENENAVQLSHTYIHHGGRNTCNLRLLVHIRQKVAHKYTRVPALSSRVARNVPGNDTLGNN